VTALSLQRIDDRTLESTAWNGEAAVVHAKRVARSDGRLLVLLQASVAGLRPAVRTSQVYERRPGA
jgi:hypothetical protein